MKYKVIGEENAWYDSCIHCQSFEKTYKKWGLCDVCYRVLKRKGFLDDHNVEYEEKTRLTNLTHLFGNLYLDEMRDILVYVVRDKTHFKQLHPGEGFHIFKRLNSRKVTFEICDKWGTIINECHHFFGEAQKYRDEKWVYGREEADKKNEPYTDAARAVLAKKDDLPF